MPAPLALPVTDGDWNAFVTYRCAAHLGAAQVALAALEDGSPRPAEDVLGLWNDVNLALSDAFALVSLLAQVHPDETVRTRAEAREQDVQRLITDIGLDRALYDVLVDLDRARLDDETARLLDRSLRDFRRAGVDRDASTRDRLREIAARETVLGQEFSRNARDDVRSIELTPDRLAGLPADFVDAHPPGPDGRVRITTDYPDVVPFRTFAHDAAARRELTVANFNRGWPANDAVLRELLAVRAEHAQLLGYPDWADFDAEVKMIGSGPAIPAFIDRIAAAADASARRDRDVLLARLRRDRPAAPSIDSADVPYYAELVRRENFDVDAQQVRRYFDFAAVRAGLLDVTGRLFGLDYHAVPDAPVWHRDVTVYDVVADGARRGRIYLDLAPRAGKYKHAAQFSLVTGIAGRQLPEGALVCNLPGGLMEHSDVITLFHEFGHLVHHVLGGGQRWSRFSGVATEWDFVEAPSQLLEEWAWDAQVLRSFARDADGAPIPVELVTKMRAAKEFGRGYLTRTQMFYAAVSYVLHHEPVDDLTETLAALQARYDMFPYIAETHFHAAFGHLDGYSSAYYTYMWSLVIAKDLFSAFDPADLFDPAVAHRYRDLVLAPGGSRDAADLVADFLGRPYDSTAFADWLAAGQTSQGRRS